MDRRRLGRTGLEVGILSMGTGGHKLLGQTEADRRPERDMLRVLHQAHELGLTHFDTSPDYAASESILGRALRGLSRSSYTVSTKAAFANGEHVMSPKEIERSVRTSIAKLGCGYLDVMFIAGTMAAYADVALERQVPVLERLRAAGAIRFLGSSEVTRSDGAHAWLRRLLPHPSIDVVMVGHNLLNQSAKRSVFPLCRAEGLGVINVFTVRKVFSNPRRLHAVFNDLASDGLVDVESIASAAALERLLANAGVSTLVEAAYRYAAFTDPVSTVMCGSIDISEIEQNIAFIERGPLPTALLMSLTRAFERVDRAVGN